MKAERGWLEAFVAVSRAGTVGRAAAQLRRTQPSISNRIRELESAWEVSLFRRGPRGMTLTPEGSRLLPVAEASLAQLESLDGRARNQELKPRELRIGSGDALGRILVPRALGALQQREPELAVRVVEGSAQQLLGALETGEIDLALILTPLQTERPDHLSLEPLCSSPVELLYPPESTSARPRSVQLEALRGQRLVTLQQGSAFRRRLESAYIERDMEFRPAVEVGSLSLVRRYVAAGLGVAPVPAVAFDQTDDSLDVGRCPIDGLGPLRYAVASRTSIGVSSAGRAFVALVGTM